MKRCPDCNRLGVDYDPFIKHERCLYNDCSFINKDDKKIDNKCKEYNYSAFTSTIQTKRDISLK